MRIVSGIYRGRIVDAPSTGDLRPTQDRVRETLFDILRPEMPGAVFLDLFAGSGAVGLEALSQGAASAVFVERDPRHAAVAERNIAKLGAAGAEVVRCDVDRWIASYRGAGFTIAFADPPYAIAGSGWTGRFLDALAKHGVVRPDGLFAAETSSSCRADEPEGWTLLREKNFGKTKTAIWRRNK